MIEEWTVVEAATRALIGCGGDRFEELEPHLPALQKVATVLSAESAGIFSFDGPDGYQEQTDEAVFVLGCALYLLGDYPAALSRLESIKLRPLYCDAPRFHHFLAQVTDMLTHHAPLATDLRHQPSPGAHHLVDTAVPPVSPLSPTDQFALSCANQPRSTSTCRWTRWPLTRCDMPYGWIPC